MSITAFVRDTDKLQTIEENFRRRETPQGVSVESMKKRIIAIGLCVAMAVSMVGCGSKKNNDSSDENVGKINSSGENTEYNEENTVAVMTGTDYKATVNLPDYTAMKVGESTAEVKDEDLKSLICFFMTSGYYNIDDTHMNHKEGTVEKYDVVNIDYSGKVDGEAFDGGTDPGFNLAIGTGKFIDGFEDGLLGVKTGETVDLNLTFPENYSEDLGGKDVVFTVTVNYINEFTDEFVADNASAITYFLYQNFSTYSDIKTVDEFYEVMKKGIKVFNVAPQLFSDIKDQSEVERDEEVLADFITEKKKAYVEYAEKNDMSLDEVISSYAGLESEAEFDEYLSDIYDSYAVMFAIAKQENIEISEEEYKAVVNGMISQSGGNFEDMASFQQSYPKQGTVDDLICGKVYYRLTDVVQVVPDDEIETTASSEDAEAAENQDNDNNDSADKQTENSDDNSADNSDDDQDNYDEDDE